MSATVGTAVLLGNVVYGPYGNVLSQAGSMGTSKGYTGQYNDATGLDYYHARYYDPVVGRFVSADIVQGNLLGFNPYAYVSGNPVTMTDPTGKCDGWCIGLGIFDATEDIMDPLQGMVVLDRLTSTAADDFLHGRAPTNDELTKAWWESNTTSPIYTTSALMGGVCLAFGGCNTKAAISMGVGSSGLTSYVENDWLPVLTDAADEFYEQHVVDHPQSPQQGEDPHTGSNNGGFQFPTQPGHTTKPESGGSGSTQQNNTTVVSSGGEGVQPVRSGGNPISYGGTSYTVVSGDTLWGIAASFYGSGYQWNSIYQANIGVIGGNPDLIYPGERLTIPR